MLPWLLTLALLMAAIALWVKTRLLQRTFDELSEGLEERLSTDTNTLLSIPSRDRHARRLAEGLNRQLRLLRARRRRYETGDRELKEAVTNLSHDLRTPLTAIRGYLDLLEGEEGTAEAKRYLARVRERTEAMERLTGELFRYSVALSGEPEPELEELDLRGALEESLAGFYAPLKERGIEPEVRLPEGPVVRRLDRRLLGRALENVLSNALKYSAGDLEAELTGEGEFRFSNASPGLDEVSVGRLFDRFFTVETGRSSTGLGLSIARTLAERMGGTAGASWAGGRLTVWLRFPQSE